MKRRYPDAPIPAVGVIVRSDDAALLILRSNEPFRGYWTFPGGAIELGETAPEAACREALEETGLTVELDGVALVVDNVVRDADGRVAYHYVIIDYFAHTTGGTLAAGTDVGDARWITRHELDTLPITAKALEVLRHLLT